MTISFSESKIYMSQSKPAIHQSKSKPHQTKPTNRSITQSIKTKPNQIQIKTKSKPTTNHQVATQLYNYSPSTSKPPGHQKTFQTLPIRSSMKWPSLRKVEKRCEGAPFIRLMAAGVFSKIPFVGGFFGIYRNWTIFVDDFCWVKKNQKQQGWKMNLKRLFVIVRPCLDEGTHSLDMMGDRKKNTY